MKKRIFVVVILLAVLVSTCQNAEYKMVQLKLYGLILPGKTSENNEIIVKYIWEGGSFTPLSQNRLRSCT